MKLNPEFVTQDLDGVQIMVATGEAKFNGIVRSNATAAFIVDQLKAGTDRQGLIDAIARKYDAPRERIAADVEEILQKLREIGALEE